MTQLVEGGTFFYTLGSVDVTKPPETVVWNQEIPTGKEVAELWKIIMMRYIVQKPVEFES